MMFSLILYVKSYVCGELTFQITKWSVSILRHRNSGGGFDHKLNLCMWFGISGLKPGDPLLPVVFIQHKVSVALCHDL